MNTRVVLGRTLRTSVWYPLLTVVGIFLWQYAAGYNLRDEGFLWYGAKAVGWGDVPMRDFMAYDPGRYYYIAAVMRLFGDSSVVMLRTAVMLLQLACVLVYARVFEQLHPVTHWYDECISAVGTLCLVLWMFPRHKVIDIAMSLLLVVVFAWCFTRPERWRFFVTGVVIGLVACVGRNHGFYGAVAAVVLVGLALVRPELRRTVVGALWHGLLGVLVGYSPILAMVIWVPGFGSAFADSLRFLVEIKGTNMPLPLPWLWSVALATPRPTLHSWGIATIFTLLCAASIGALVWVVAQTVRRRPVPAFVAASAVLSCLYTQTAISRADLAHIAQSIAPLVILALASARLVPQLRARVALTLTVAVSTLVILPVQPGIVCRSDACVPVSVAGHTVWATRADARTIALFREIDAAYGQPGRSGYFAPFWPGAYALLDQRAPVWELYPTWQRVPAFEQRELALLAARRPAYVVWSDASIDNRNELRFSVTHPLTVAYLERTYVDVPAYQTDTLRVMKESDSGR